MREHVLPASCFTRTRHASRDALAEAIKSDLASLPEQELPLARMMQHGSMPVAGSVCTLLHQVHSDQGVIRARLSLLFRSVEAGCACENDPTPMNELQECASCTLEIDPAIDVARLRWDEDMP